MQIYTVGVNAPGYMPDTEPTTCTDWAQACEALKDEIRRTLDVLDAGGNTYDDAALSKIEIEIDAFEREGPQDSAWHYFGLRHWIVVECD